MPEITKSPSNGSAPKTEPWHEDPGSFARFTDRLSPLPLADPSLKNSPVKRKRRFISRIRNLTPDTYEVVVQYENDGDPFGFQAGQYAVPSHTAISKPRSYLSVVRQIETDGSLI